PRPTQTHTLSLHDALPIFRPHRHHGRDRAPVTTPSRRAVFALAVLALAGTAWLRCGPLPPGLLDLDEHVSTEVVARDGEPLRERSEEHTSELQSRENLVCR